MENLIIQRKWKVHISWLWKVKGPSLMCWGYTVDWNKWLITPSWRYLTLKSSPFSYVLARCGGYLQRITARRSEHLFACKRFPKVAARTPNEMVYGELGRYPIQISCYTRVIKYCIRLLKMDPACLPNQAYHMLRSLDSSGKCYCASNIRSLLQGVGLGYVW